MGTGTRGARTKITRNTRCAAAAGHEGKRVSRRVGSLAWSGPAAGVHVEHPTAERHGPLPLARYAFAVIVAGYPAAGDPPRSGPALGHPGAEARRRHVRLILGLGTT
jgi:hypothetical protein